MELDRLTKLAREVANAYGVKNAAEGREPWTVDNYMAGFVGDVGDLSKLIMANSGYRAADRVEERLAHELSDCLWSILVIADKLGIDLASTFQDNMRSLLDRVSARQ